MGRRKENREKLTCYVKPQTKRKIRRHIVKGDTLFNTAGKIVDEAVEGLP